MTVPAAVNVVTLGARDLGKLRGFYRWLGWSLAVYLDDFAAFQTSGAVLALFPLERLAADGRVPSAAPERGMRGFSLALVVSEPQEVDQVIATVREAGGTITKEPVDAEEFEGRSAYFADPEDDLWEVAFVREESRMAAAIREATAAPDPPA